MMHAERKTPAVLTFGCVALLVAACGRDEGASAQARTAVDLPPIPVETVTAVARQVPRKLAATGTLVSERQSQVTAIVPGRVTKVLVERGMSVKEGQPLVKLRDVDYRFSAEAAGATLEQSRARLGLVNGEGQSRGFNPMTTPEVKAAEANRDVAEDALKRAQALKSSGAISDQEFEQRSAAAAAAREQYAAAVNNAKSSYAQFRNAQVQLDSAQRSLSDSTVRAPFAGEIAERKVNVGEFVTAQTAVVTLVQIDPLRMEIQIPQERIPFVKAGQAVEIRVDAFPDRVFQGTVRYISAAVSTSSRALVAEAVVPNAEGTLRPGLFATARIVLDGEESLTEVPNAAVRSEAGTHRVFVVAGGRIQERVVSIADRTSTHILIAQGVKPGERLAVTELSRLGDGAKVVEKAK